MAQTYSTKEVADKTGIHVNTVRFYEEIGFITKPRRQLNGYRVYTDLHIEQCRLVRRAMKTEVLQNGLRKKAADIVRLCAALDFNASLSAAHEYIRMIDREIQGAKSAVTAVEKTIKAGPDVMIPPMRRAEAARTLHVTVETLRTWERNGLIRIKRGSNGYRQYSADDMKRLNIIRTLRCANYSLSAILRLMSQLDRHETRPVEMVLNTPGENEDIVSVCDRLVISLGETRADAEQLVRIIESMMVNFEALQ